MKKEWKEGTVQDFLGLSDSDMALIETKIALTKKLRERRQTTRMTQTDLARAMHTSQSRVAKIEAGDPSVSLDLIFTALTTAGVTRKGIGRAIIA